MDDLRRSLSELDAIQVPELWPEIQRRAHAPTAAPSRGPWRFPSVVSATKFVVAGVVVGLFGGFLLTGVLNSEPSDQLLPGIEASASAPVETEPTAEPQVTVEPATVADLLRGVDLTVQRVEPGVLRVLDDGIRDLVAELRVDTRMRGPIVGNVVVGRDGSVWMFRLDRFFRLGAEQSHAWGRRFGPTPRNNELIQDDDDLSVGPDGRVIARQDGRLISFDGKSWTKLRELGDLPTDVPTLYIGRDGTIWVYVNEEDLAWLGPDGWGSMGGGGSVPRTARMKQLDLERERGLERAPIALFPQTIELGDAVLGPRDTNDAGVTWTYRWVESPVIDESGAVTAIDKTTYLVRTEDEARDDGIEIVIDVFTSGDGVPRMASCQQHLRDCSDPGLLKTAPDGRVWMSPGQDPEPRCSGIATFDKTTWDRYLDGYCIHSVDIDADGNAWLLARDPGADGELEDLGRQYVGGFAPVELYVVRPDVAG